MQRTPKVHVRDDLRTAMVYRSIFRMAKALARFKKDATRVKKA
jgi:hypothetical protein